MGEITFSPNNIVTSSSQYMFKMFFKYLKYRQLALLKCHRVFYCKGL